MIVSTVPKALEPIDRGLRSAGHQPVAVITRPRHGYPGVGAINDLTPRDCDLLVPSSKERIAPLLRAYEPDVLLCFAFPWLIPPEALAVQRIGAVNLHPSLLPRHSGPNPIGWTFRNDDPEFGVTVHLMAETFDTGRILAQGSFPVEDEDHVSNLGPKFESFTPALVAHAFDRLAAGDTGDPQTKEGHTWAGLMEDEWAEIDWTRTAREVHNQVRSWMFPSKSGLMGALTDLDGERVRIVRTSLHPAREADGAPGTVVAREDDRLLVQCRDQPLWVLETAQP